MSFKGVSGLFALVLLAASGAYAQDTPVVNVTVSKALASRTEEVGTRDLENLKKDLKDEVVQALARAKGGPLRPRLIELVLEDARPNRPTFAQLGANPGLSMRSISIGGARIGGRLVDGEGREHVFHMGFFETDIRNERAASVWSDAYLAFDMVAHRIASGRLSDD
jgi:hypothetical protein